MAQSLLKACSKPAQSPVGVKTILPWSPGKSKSITNAILLCTLLLCSALPRRVTSMGTTRSPVGHALFLSQGQCCGRIRPVTVRLGLRTTRGWTRNPPCAYKPRWAKGLIQLPKVSQ
jgi:hypothetical protein